jgi:hypothetical protein
MGEGLLQTRALDAMIAVLFSRLVSTRHMLDNSGVAAADRALLSAAIWNSAILRQ